MAATYRTHYEERAWIEAHREEFLDQWVALDGNNLVAHGTDARAVYDEARAQGVDSLISSMSRQRLTPTLVDGWANHD